MRPIPLLRLLLVSLLCLSPGSLLGQDSYKVEAADASTLADFPQALLEKLDAPGARVVGSQGAVCTVWLRKGVPTKADSGAMGVIHGGLENGSFLGALHFPKEGADFRARPIKPGYYTLRYALIPQDGAHMGVFQTRDSLVLSPVSVDTDLEKNLSFDEMVKLSRQASGTPHPAFLVMSAVYDSQNLPAIAKDDLGNWSLQLKLQGTSGELPVGITVVGKWEGE